MSLANLKCRENKPGNSFIRTWHTGGAVYDDFVEQIHVGFRGSGWKRCFEGGVSLFYVYLSVSSHLASIFS
jgi:hypothetical protein